MGEQQKAEEKKTSTGFVLISDVMVLIIILRLDHFSVRVALPRYANFQVKQENVTDTARFLWEGRA